MDRAFDYGSKGWGFESLRGYDKTTKRMLQLNDIKKILYKDNPSAVLTQIRKGVAYYSAFTISGTDQIKIYFEVPVSDMGDADFLSHMDSKYLIRWLVSFTEC